VTNRTPADNERWMAQGSKLFFSTLAAVPNDRLDGPTALPGWTGKHLLAHIAANAEALTNLAHWARTGDETPMYSSQDQRNADIEAGARKPAARLRTWAMQSSEDLHDRLSELDDECLRREVRTAQGRMVPAREIAWMRAREMMIHTVDLAAGPGFADLPADFLTALVDEISAKRSDGQGPALVLTDHDRTWTVTGSGQPTLVPGTPAELAEYLTGRRAGLGPDLPNWL
jgi:maleylpyruvate isomerase